MHNYDEQQRYRPPLECMASNDDKYCTYTPHSLIGRLSACFSMRQRLKLYNLFMQASAAEPEDSLLDLGVTSEECYVANNYIEDLYPYKHRITAAGLAGSSYLPARYPGLNYVQVVQDSRLPFANRSFNLVHSSAVIEHVGSREQQLFFLKELWRVAQRMLFITTPNRWFPVEVHTVIPLLHWLPPVAFRACLKATGGEKHAAYADESQLNLLSRIDLYRLAQEAGLKRIRICGVRLGGFTSNLVLLAYRDQEVQP